MFEVVVAVERRARQMIIVERGIKNGDLKKDEAEN